MFVKICGITSEEDGLLAVALDADAVGFILAPSPRQIAPVVARDIARRLPPEVISVGVFRDEAPERVVSIVHEAGLRAAQLNGRESAEATRFVAERVPLVIKTFAAGSPQLARAAEYGAAVIMLDSGNPGRGEAFDWGLAADVPRGCRLLLAGGLTPENVTDAITVVEPWGVDVATGVERGIGPPGRKDPSKVRRFVANARAAAPEGQPDEELVPYDWIEET